MEYLFTSRNLKILESFTMVRTLYAFDFDGTLAPIVDDPEQSKLSESMARKILRLQEKVQIAIITGRKVDDVLKRLPFTPNFILGNHGLEGILDDGEYRRLKEIRSNWLQILYEYRESHFDPMNIKIEDKSYSITLHFRNSSDPDKAREICMNITDLLKDAKVSGGHMVVNILPAMGIDKGVAFDKLLKAEQFTFGFYVGDDVTDEDIFKISGPNTFTIRIGAETQSKAKYYLKSQDEMELLLDQLLLLHHC